MKSKYSNGALVSWLSNQLYLGSNILSLLKAIEWDKTNQKYDIFYNIIK